MIFMFRHTHNIIHNTGKLSKIHINYPYLINSTNTHFLILQYYYIQTSFYTINCINNITNRKRLQYNYLCVSCWFYFSSFCCYFRFLFHYFVTNSIVLCLWCGLVGDQKKSAVNRRQNIRCLWYTEEEN